MASQLLGIKTRFTNDLGSPLVGGQVYTYFAGTSTNQDSYSDAALTVPNTNPVILDDTGSADIFLKGSYRIRVFDASGRFIEEQDNVSQPSSSTDVASLTGRVITVEEKTSMIGVVYNTLSTETAKLLNIKDDVTSIRTQRFSDVDKGGALYARSTELDVEPHSPLAWFQTADGAYWLLDEANPTPEMFGAKGDLDYTLIKKGDLTGVNADACGHRYLSGTNDIEAFNAAMRYAKLRNCEKVKASGEYYIKSFSETYGDGVNNVFAIPFDYEDSSEITVLLTRPQAHLELPAGSTGAEMTAAQHYQYRPTEYTVTGDTITLNVAPPSDGYIAVSQVFTVKGSLEVSGTLWTHYNLVAQGVKGSSGSKYTADLTIGQYVYGGGKPGGKGHWGSVLIATSGYLEEYDHDLVADVLMESRVIRAARIRADANSNIENQLSLSSNLTGALGNVYNAQFVVDPYDAQTNVASGSLCNMHWGARYTPKQGQKLIDALEFDVVTSYHPEFCSLTTKEVIKKSDHGINTVIGYSDTINCSTSDIICDGLKLIYLAGVGDLVGAFAQPSQKGRVNNDNKIGYVTGYNIEPDIYSALVKGDGGSKNEFYEGAEIALQRQGSMNLTVKGHTLYSKLGVGEGIRMRGISENVDLGTCRIKGFKKSLYVLSGTGNWSADIAEADCPVHIQNNKGGTLLRTNINLGDSENAVANDLYAKGYAAGNCTVHLDGSYPTTTIRAVAVKGATKIDINAFTAGFSTVSIGDTLRITNTDGTICTTKATALAVDGALTVEVTPLPVAIVAGASVVLDLGVELDYLNMTSKSSEFGLYSRNATIKKLDFSNMGWSGRHCAKIYNTKAAVVGTLPSNASRRIVSTTDQAIWADYDCRLLGQNLQVLKNSSTANKSFYFATRSNGDLGTLTLNGGVVEDITTLASFDDPMQQLHFNGVVNLKGQLLTPAGRSGSNASGYWVKHADGSMECWARNIALGSTKPYVWTFPQAFINTESTFVNCTSTSVTDSRVGSALAISATQAHVWLNKNDATATDVVAAAGMSLYAKGFWK